jgi:hypothetical protein
MMQACNKTWINMEEHRNNEAKTWLVRQEQFCRQGNAAGRQTGPAGTKQASTAQHSITIRISFVYVLGAAPA